MTVPSKDQLKAWLASPAPLDDLRGRIRQSPTTPLMLNVMRGVLPDQSAIPHLTYTLYREFEHTGSRAGYETPYFLKRGMLTHAVLEYLMGDESVLDRIHDLIWSICEETTWVLPAHEEQGPDYWRSDPVVVRSAPFGAHTALTREPDAIDLFAAETGASLAETLFLLGDALAPEVRQRARQEVERHIFKPYLAYGRKHWWFKGPLNWNGVCNGAIGLAFLRLEKDLETLAEALEMVLEGFEAYIATGFEADGGSIEGVGYWNYGLLYYVTVAELMREITGGALDLLAQPRMRAIAAYPPGMVLVAPNRFINFGDASENQVLSAGIVTRLAERTGVDQLRALLAFDARAASAEANAASAHEVLMRQSANFFHKLAIIMRFVGWWDCTAPRPHHQHQDYILPHSGVVKLVGQTASGLPVILATKAGNTDGHHCHTDIATFILNIGGESLIPDAGRGLYSKEYFRQARYQNIFNNSYSHNVPRIGGALQSPGPEFGGHGQFFGTIVTHGEQDGVKTVEIDFHKAYDLPALTGARRRLALHTADGVVSLEDVFAFAGAPLSIEEAFVTWHPVELEGGTARILGDQSVLELRIQEPAGAAFTLESLEEACRANEINSALYRLAAALPEGSTRFKMLLTPHTKD